MKILLAYDGFEHSQHALEEVARLARDGEGPTAVTIASVAPESEARASKSGGHRFLAPHAHLDVARAHAFLAEQGIESTMQVLHVTRSRSCAAWPKPADTTSWLRVRASAEQWASSFSGA